MTIRIPEGVITIGNIVPKTTRIVKHPLRSAVLRRPKFQYRDPKYGFSLRLPCWWKSYIVIRRRTRLTDAEYGVFFLFKYKGKVYEDVLSIQVFRLTRKQWREQGYEESPFILLAERNGRIFAYLTPEELPDEFLDKTKMDYDYKKYGKQIRLLKRMVNEDVPKIVKTFKFT